MGKPGKESPILKIQEYLATHRPEDLEAEHGIGAKRHPQFPNLVMFKYSQINANMAERIVQECRGIILNEAEGWSIVSRPYDKFFNYGEGFASPIDWPSARVYEKLDGSLMTLYHYAGEWRVASSGLPDAGGAVNNSAGGSFADLFWRVWNSLRYALPTNTDICYMFELMTPHNRVVIPHTIERIVLHGARVLKSGEELMADHVAEPGWKTVQSFSLGSLDEVVAAAGILKPMENEGFVVADKYFHRVKVKSPQYIALAHMKDNFTVGRMLELVRANEGEEFLTYFPELRPDFERVRSLYARFCESAKQMYETIRGEVTQKDFAMKAKESEYAPVLFAMRAGKASSPESFIAGATITAAVRLLGLKEYGGVTSESKEVTR